MATYQSPGVYVEETDSGNKPIEGVSTSTAGVVGVTERGPANVPTLLTSFGDYQRAFGGYLPIGDFSDPGGRAHCYLPHAVEGFFTNGGKLMYVTRVTSESAKRADRDLFFDDVTVTNVANPSTVLLRPAEQATGTAANPLYVLKGTTEPPALNNSTTIRIGDGSRAEYRTVTLAGPTPQPFGSVSLPLQRHHAVLAPIAVGTVATAAFAYTFVGAQVIGSTVILVQAANQAGATALATAPTPTVLQLASEGTPSLEYVVVASIVQVNPTDFAVTLVSPLQLDHADGDAIKLVTTLPGPAATYHLQEATKGGDSILISDGSITPSALTPILVIDEGVLDTDGTPLQEVRVIGTLKTLEPALPPYDDYPAGSRVESVLVADDTRTVAPSPPSTTTKVYLTDVTGLAPGMTLVFTTGTTVIQSVVPDPAPAITIAVTVFPALSAAPTGTVAIQASALAAAVDAGAMILPLNARAGFGLGATADVLRVGIAPNFELVRVIAVSEPRGAGPDAGTIILDRPLQRSYPQNTEVQREVVTVLSAATTIVLEAPEGAPELLIADGTAFVAGPNLIARITLPSEDQFYHVIDAVDSPTVEAVVVDTPLARSHKVNSTVVQREPIFLARALDTGGWGNRVLVTIADEEVGLLSRADVLAGTPSSGSTPSTLQLSTVTGVEAGTVIEILDSTGTTSYGLVKVQSIDKTANNLVILDSPGLSAAQAAAIASAPPTARLSARSREFRMQVLLLARPNPAIPIRKDDLLDQELFRSLSMDPRHSHYFERTIGATWVDAPGTTTDDLGRPLRRSDHRSEGSSQYVRVQDLGATEAIKESIRLGPEDLIDTLPSGLTRPARLALGDGVSTATYGDDGVSLMDDQMYTGDDNNDAALRTGIFALENQQDISLIAVPGQVTPVVQQALIDQCENMLYRFAVLDAQGPDDDTIDDVTTQRQQFDTKYAAFYHPWLTIADPFPTNLQSIAQYPIPPSGHMLGIYARVDDSRGVHKAPANEVVGGMTGLTRYLNQSDQDVLNAEPVNIDVIRDFRLNNRGIRVWGARVITSDSDWKYVNVRRLMIFIEASLNQGLQWVVFEPNDETLWGRVRRTVSSFLTTVWRNGALEGDTKDQAFYVKCDRTTMTQDDLENGRLICVVGVAPVYPAEFVIIRIGLWTADASS